MRAAARGTRISAAALGALVALACGGAALPATPADAATGAYLRDSFSGPDRLRTNAYASSSPTNRTAVHDGLWETTAGSLFDRGGAGWTGVPDAGPPDQRSATRTGSAVFRMRSHRTDIGNAAVDLRLRTDRWVTTSRTPSTSWDGVHVWLRYQSEEELYVVQINRRDGLVTAKRKVPGGPSNGGTYVQLGAPATVRVPLGAWQSWSVSSRDTGTGQVVLEARVGGRLVLSRTDSGVRLADGRWRAPLPATGRVGIRGDNAQFALDDLVVRPLSAVAPAQHTVVRIGAPATTVYTNPIPLTVRAWRAGAPLAAATVRLERLVPGGAWTSVARTTTDAAGRAAFAPVASGRASWRARVAGTATATSGASHAALVRVRVRAYAKAVPTTVRRGTASVLTGRVWPTLTGRQVHLERLDAGVWRRVATTTVAADGTYRKAVRVDRTSAWRAVVPGAGLLDTGTTGTVTITAS